MARRLKAGGSITVGGQTHTVTAVKGNKIYYKTTDGKRGSTVRR